MSSSKKWAEFKFSAIGYLLAAPPDYGKLRLKLEELSNKSWKHPISGEAYRISLKTLEKWYYLAINNGDNPVEGLAPKVRSDRGQNRALSDWMKNQLKDEAKKHPGWSKQLHFDNLKVLITTNNQGKAPSYS
jgi:putative transposase